MKIIPLLVLLLWCSASRAQTMPTFSSDSSRLSIDVRQNALMERLLQTHLELVSSDSRINGFRVQIYSDSGNQSKLRTQRRQAEFARRYPDVPSYITFDAPEFKLRVGNFRTRLDARRFLETIAREYEGAFIVVDLIQFPGFD